MRIVNCHILNNGFSSDFDRSYLDCDTPKKTHKRQCPKWCNINKNEDNNLNINSVNKDEMTSNKSMYNITNAC